LKALDTVKHHLEVTLSDANIANRLSWSEAEVQEIFSPNLRKRFAVYNISDPLKALEDWEKGNLVNGWISNNR